MKVEAVLCRNDKEEQRKSKVKIRHTHVIYLFMIYNSFGYNIGTTTEHIFGYEILLSVQSVLVSIKDYLKNNEIKNSS